MLALVDPTEAARIARLASEPTLLAHVTTGGGGEAQEALTRAAWGRFPERLHHWLEEKLQDDPGDPGDPAVARLLAAAPDGERARLIEALHRLRSYNRGLPPSITDWLIARVRRQDAGWEAAWRVWLGARRGHAAGNNRADLPPLPTRTTR